MSNTIRIILTFCIFPTLALKILSIKDVEEADELNISIKRPPQLKTDKFSFCWWVKLARSGDYTYLGNHDDTSITLSDGVGQSLWVNGIWAISLPGRLRIVPHIFWNSSV